MPQLAAIEESDEIEGLLVLLNTVGGDIEAGLGIAEMIASMNKPTASLFSAAHSIGVPLAVAARHSVIAPSAAMDNPSRAPDGRRHRRAADLRLLCKVQERIVQFVTKNSRIKRERFTEMMLKTGELAADVGTIISGQQAVADGLVDQLGGLSDALDWLHIQIDKNRRKKAEEDARIFQTRRRLKPKRERTVLPGALRSGETVFV